MSDENYICLKELDFVITYVNLGIQVDFTIYNVVGWGENSTPFYTTVGGKTCTSSIEEAEVYLHGKINWDGCSDWYFDEQDRRILHGCTREDLERYGNVLKYCWDLASTLIPSFDGDIN